MQNGQGNVFRPSGSGKRLRRARLGASITGEARSTRRNATAKRQALVTRRRSPNIPLGSVLMGALTWQGTSESCLRTGMTQKRKIRACSVAVPGPTYRWTCVYRTGTGTSPTSGSTAHRFPSCPGHSLTLCPLLFDPLPRIRSVELFVARLPIPFVVSTV